MPQRSIINPIAALKAESNPFPQYEKPYSGSEPPKNPELYQIFEEKRDGQRNNWFWNGSLWVSTELRFVNGLNGTGLSATSGSSNNLIVFTRSLFVERVIYAGRINGTHDATNYWTFTWSARKKSDTVFATLFELDSKNYLSKFSLPISPIEIVYKQLIDKDIYYAITPRIAKVQSPATLETYSSTLYFRHVRPQSDS